MSYDRKIAIWVAVLFIVATAASVASLPLLGPAVDSENMIAALAEAPNLVIAGVLLIFTAAAAIVAIPVVFFPLLRRYSETGAMLYFTARLFEATAFVLGGIFTLGQLNVARNGYDLSLAITMKDLSDIAYGTGPTLFFGIGAIVLAVLLIATRLVPSWLSWWKLVGGAMITVQGILTLAGPLDTAVETMLFMPIAVNEMVLALWLIVKGFDTGAVAKLGP